MKWVISAEDVKRGQLVQPGWHNADITDFQEKLTKSGDSNNVIFYFKLTSGPNAGAVVQALFNEKAPGFLTNLLEALHVTKNDDGSFAVELNKTTVVGKSLKVFVKRDEYEGKPQNKVTDYAPID